MVEKVCVVCTKEFDGHFKSIVCSDECSRMRTNQRARYKREAKRKLRKCVICSNFFLNRRAGSLTCGVNCCSIHQVKTIKIIKAKKSEKNKDNKKCIVCGCNFITGNPLKKVCSKNCYKQTQSAAVTNVRKHLRYLIGFEPTPELVEEATALRLLNRAIKKAGE